jgi:hypothetical protein
MWFEKDHDITFKGFLKKIFQLKLESYKVVNQFQLEDYLKLGAELHAASYALKLSGKSRLHGSTKWLELGENKLKDMLPQERTNDLFVEGLDLSKTCIQFMGINNFGKNSLLIVNTCNI